MGDVALDRGDLVLSRKRYEESLDLRNQAGEKQTATESRVSLAKLAVEEGRATDAETSTRACKQQFQQDQQRDGELSASIALMDALLAEGKQGEAQKEMEAAQALGNATQNRFLRLQFELVSGRVVLASDHPDASRALFQRVAGGAHRYGFLGLEFANELALAQLSNKMKHVSQGQIELHALQKSANSRGFGLVARKALHQEDSAQ